MTYSAEVLADSPLAYYRLGEASGTTITDSSGNGRDAAWTVTPTQGVNGLLVGDADDAVDLNGSTHYGQISDASGALSWLDVPTITLEAWVKPDVVNQFGIITARDNDNFTGDNMRYWQLRISNLGKAQFIFYASDGGATQVLTGTTTMVVGNTYHIVATYDGSVGRIYLNGSQENTITISGAIQTSTVQANVGIGRTLVSTPFWYNGVLDELAYYSGALSAGRIAVHYTAGTTVGGTTVNGGLATETDSALTGSVFTSVVGGLATETNSALAGTVTAGSVIAGGIATETDSALAGTVIEGVYVSGGLALETDSALAGTLTIGSVIVGGLATEADEALTGLTLETIFVNGGLAVETDSALAGAIVDADTILGGIAQETDTALAGVVSLGYSTTDTTNLVGGRIRSGYASFTWSPAVVDPDVAIIGPMPHDYDKAHAFTAPTVSNGRVVPYSPTIVATPRHRDRILVGGKDVTYFRGIHTPTPSYRLVEPLLWGAGTLVLPQVNPLFEALGTGSLSWLKPGKPVKVQRVDPDTNAVIATDYSGFITALSIDGGDLTCDLGGEVTGRMALKHQQVPVFKSVIESNRMMYDSVVGNSPRPYTPRLGTPTGIQLAKFGGLNKLDHFNQLMALNTQLDGDQWTVMLKANGTWGNMLKDRETVDFTIYFDDARIPTSLNRDISEEPNRVYATAVAPDGHKIDFRVYPGLKQGEAPDYPMSGGGSFGVGTTDEDTDTGDGITSMVSRLIVMGYLSRADGYAYDADVVEAIKQLQDDAGLAESGTMNQATWRALYDLDATGYSLAGATTLPAAQRSSVRQWNRTSSGALSSRNPNFNPHKIVVDTQVDMGTGFTAQQVRQWSRGELSGDEENWVGTATLHFTVIAGEHTPGDPIDPADVMPARAIRPGMNGFAPLFDGGTLFHVSGVEVPAGGRAPVLTLDTRARDTMKVWEVIQRNRDSRRDPARVWLNQYRSSKITKDGLGPWDKVGGLLDDRVVLSGGNWTVFPVVAGQEGTIRRLRIRTNPNTEFCAAVFGRKVSARRLNHLMPNPLAENGSKWTKEWIQGWLEDRVYLDSWGDFEQPAGYSPGAKSDEDPLTGNLYDDAQLSYHTFAEPVLWVAVWAADDTVIPPGRIMWQQLEEGS